MSLELWKKTVDFLKERAEVKFTARDIASWVYENYKEECDKKRERSQARKYPLDTHEKFMQQLVAEIGSIRAILERKHNIRTTEERPRRYYYTEKEEIIEIQEAESSSDQQNVFSEHDLYPILTTYLSNSELEIYSKRIDERKSKNNKGSGGNKWLHPDVVGVEYLGNDWHEEVKNCVNEYQEKQTKLWSFEVKIKVNRSNVREVFFQAVSNSSWANFGYLVANEIQGSDTLKELRILSGLHGIGLIRLDNESPADSEILIPAKEKNDVDWNTINRLVEENPDFEEYIIAVSEIYQTNKLKESNWDKPIEYED